MKSIWNVYNESVTMKEHEVQQNITEAKSIEKEQKLNKGTTNDSLKAKALRLVGEAEFENMMKLMSKIKSQNISKEKQLEELKTYCGNNSAKNGCAFYLEQMMYDMKI